MAIVNSLVTNSTAAAIYTSSGNTAIVTIHLCNYTGTNQTVNVYVVPSGGVAGYVNQIYSNLQLSAYNTWIINSEKFILNNGDTILANTANASSVSATVSSIGI